MQLHIVYEVLTWLGTSLVHDRRSRSLVGKRRHFGRDYNSSSRPELAVGAVLDPICGTRVCIYA